MGNVRGRGKGAMRMKKAMRANLLLLLTATIWGAAFVAQDVAMESMPPLFFNGLRMLLAGMTLLLVLFFLRKREKAHTAAAQPLTREERRMQRRLLWMGSFLCGLMLFGGSALQQIGILETGSPGKAGFITALYIVLVPLLGLFLRKRVSLNAWVAVALCAAGLFLLCVTETFAIQRGDVYLLLCAVCFTGHILVIDHFAPRVDCVRMSCYQFLITAALCLTVAVATETIDFAMVGKCVIPLLYAGVLSGAIGYTLQIVAQRDADPTVASLILSLESLFAVLASWLLQGKILSSRELVGCAIMMVGLVLAQLPQRAGKIAPAVQE